MTNCTDGLICQIEKGQTEPSLKRLRKIAKALGVSTTRFLENEEEVKN
jgi:transcriptional regulator with XRE-family HTH domain